MQIVVQYPFMTFTRVGLGDNGQVLMPVLVISLAIMVLTLLLTPVAWIVRRRFGQKLELSGAERWTRRGVWVVFGLNLLSVIGVAGLLTYALSNIDFFGEKGKMWFWLFQIIGIFGAIGTLFGPTVMRKNSKGASVARWSGRRVAPAASAMIRCFNRMGTRALLAK
jgi:hypothetical protein